MNIGKLKLDFTHFVLIAIAIGVMILMKQCGGHGAAVAALKKQRDSLEKSEANAWTTVNELNRKFADTIRLIDGMRQLALVNAGVTERNLAAAEKRIDQILKDHKPVVVNKDTGNVIVDVDYVNNCESCIDELGKGKDSVHKYIKQRDSIDGLSRMQVMLYKKQTNELQQSIDREHSLFNALNLVAKDAIKKAIPHSHLYAGTKVSGSLITPFNQVGGMLNFLDKKGRMFTVGGGLQVQGNYYGELGISIKLF